MIWTQRLIKHVAVLVPVSYLLYLIRNYSFGFFLKKAQSQGLAHSPVKRYYTLIFETGTRLLENCFQ